MTLLAFAALEECIDDSSSRKGNPATLDNKSPNYVVLMTPAQRTCGL